MLKIRIAVIVLVLAAGSFGMSPAAAAPVSCQDVSVPVALSQGGAASYHVSGRFCTPPGWGTSNQSLRGDVDVLIPGATYTRQYWDWPIDSSVYSFAAATWAAGRATFAFDRIGSGASSIPPSAQIDITVDAFVAHQVIAWVRRDPRVEQITVVGHSLGSGVAVVEAATYHDTNRLVATGMLHSTGSGLAAVLASLQPAALISPLTWAGYDLGYLTTVPGTRAADFYSASADPVIEDYDELTKNVVSGTEMAGYPGLLAPPALDVTQRIDVPVLEVAGQQDALLCGGQLNCADAAAVQANEQPFFPAAPSVTTLTVPLTGHDLALHPSAPTTFQAIDQWIESH